MTKSKISELECKFIVIEMTNGEFINNFFPAFNQLASMPSNPDTGFLKFAIKRSLPYVREVYEDYMLSSNEINEEFAEKDNDGNAVIINQRFKFPDKNKEKKAQKLINNLKSKKIKIKVYPVERSYVTDAINLTIMQDISLGDFIA